MKYAIIQGLCQNLKKYIRRYISMHKHHINGYLYMIVKKLNKNLRISLILLYIMLQKKYSIFYKYSKKSCTINTIILLLVDINIVLNKANTGIFNLIFVFSVTQTPIKNTLSAFLFHYLFNCTFTLLNP